MPYKSRDKALQRHKRYYKEHREECLIRTRVYQSTHPRVSSKHKPKTKLDFLKQKQHRKAIRAIIRDIKETSACEDCGLLWPPAVMEFDHVSGTKRFSISTTGGYSLETILDEIAKCDLVCANCHRIRHLTRH